MLRLVSWAAIDLYGKSLVCLPANSMASCSFPPSPDSGHLGSTVNCNLLSLQPMCCKSSAIDLFLLLLYRFRWPSLLLLLLLPYIALCYSIKGFGLTQTQTDRDESSVRPFGCLAQLMISYEFCGKQDNAATAQRRAKRMPQQRDQHKDGKRSEDRKPQEFCIQFLGH